MNDFNNYTLSINCKGKLIDLSNPIVAGIINITPDSFYKNSRCIDEIKILQQAENMLEQGATFIDIGACSTRPGSLIISEEEEWLRLKKALSSLVKKFPQAIISVDTFRSAIAKRVVEEFGVSIINDISAGSFDNNMFSTIAQLQVVYIIMHIKGMPENMQQQAIYTNVEQDVMSYFSEKIATLKLLGVNDIIIDPGFGFAKTLEHNYTLLANLNSLTIFERPLMVGISRKSMIYKLLNITPEEAITGTIVANTIALLNGANILRVHDVAEAMQTIKIVSKLKNKEH